jgi:hypothetical protein
VRSALAGVSTGVIRTHAKADLSCVFEDVSPIDFPPDPVNLLVNDGLPLVNRADDRVQHEVPLGVDLQFLDASEAKHDPLWVSPRRLSRRVRK